MQRISFLHITTLLFLFFAVTHAEAYTLEQLASGLGRQMDRQLAASLNQEESPARSISLFVTTPVDINDMEVANPLARQMQEELARWFTQAGYQVQEIRKGATVSFTPDQGELFLTRTPEKLESTKVTATLVLAGTYTLTGQNIRFNIRLVQTGSQTVMAMASVTIPLSKDLASLTRTPQEPASIPIEPTVFTRLP